MDKGVGKCLQLAGLADKFTALNVIKIIKKNS